MGSAEFTAWLAYEQLEPFGPLSDDYRAGVMPATYYNMNRAKTSAPLGPGDFMPALGSALKGEPEERKPEIKLTPAQEAAYLDALFGFR